MDTFPIQGETARELSGGIIRLPGLQIPWAVAEIAYAEYVRRFGKVQTLERLAERGGFARSELLGLLDISSK